MVRLKALIQQLPAGKTALAAAVLLVAILLAFLLFPRGGENFEQAHQEVLTLAENIRNHYKTRPDYWGLDTRSALKNKIVPEKMQRKGKVYSSAGREIIIGQDGSGSIVMPGTRYFVITIANLGKKACTALAAEKFNTEGRLGLLSISIASSQEEHLFEWGGENPLPVSLQAAEQYCKNKNSVSWIFE